MEYISDCGGVECFLCVKSKSNKKKKTTKNARVLISNSSSLCESNCAN